MNRSVRIPIASWPAWCGPGSRSPSCATRDAAAPPQPVGGTARPQDQHKLQVGAVSCLPVVIGPPAPVPPEVAIPGRPQQELAQVNDVVKKFIESDSSASKPLLKKFESLLMLQPARRNVAATFTQTVQRQGPRHEGFVEMARQGNIDLLLHGDSITDWWVQGDANKAMFDKYFAGIRTANSRSPAIPPKGSSGGSGTARGRGFNPRRSC